MKRQGFMWIILGKLFKSWVLVCWELDVICNLIY